MKRPGPPPAKVRDTSKDQAGAVIVFKPGVTKAQAQTALEKLKDVLDLDYQYPKGMPGVEVFNPSWGGPVWYIP